MDDLNNSDQESDDGEDIGEDLHVQPPASDDQEEDDSILYTSSESEESVSSGSDGESDNPSSSTAINVQPHQCRWRKRESPDVNTDFLGEHFPEPPEEPISPYNYFKGFFGDKLLHHITQQTNLYSVRESGSSIGASKNEIEQYIGVLVTMSFIKLHTQRMYWQNRTRIPGVADIMTTKRFEKL